MINKSVLLKRIGLGTDILFWTTAIFTLVYWAIIAGQFVAGKEFARVPSSLNEMYFVILGTYVGANQVNKASNGGSGIKKRPGSIFVIGWVILTVLILVLVSFNIFGEENSLNLVWPLPFGAIIGIYGGSKMLKNTRKLIQTVKSIAKEPTNSGNTPS